MKKYTLDELITFIDEEKELFAGNIRLFGENPEDSEYIAKYKAIAEELWRLKNLEK